jgi:VanZ family protein
MPGRFIPSTTWLELLSFDKFVHAGIFFVLVGLLSISVKANQHQIKLFYLFVVLSILYGGALEIMQATVFSERSADWYDMIANSVGCIAAALSSEKINKLVFK